MTVEQDALAQLKPSSDAQQALLNVAHAFVKELQERIDCASIHLGGSVGKGTWLADNADIDVFVSFEKGTEALSEILEESLESYAPERIHGSRDYFRITREGYIFEVVPIIAITDPKDAENITDISPLHVTWVTTNADEDMKDQIRLAKAFFKAQRIYGAESHIKGFSGYVLEILTIHYGSFTQLLKAITKWKEKTVVDPAKYHKDVFFDVNASKLVSPLIVIDPVQAGRNAAAALSMKRFTQCIDAAKAYLKSPEITYFTPQEITLPEGAIVLDITLPEGRPDVAGCAVEKVYKHILHALKQHEFVVEDTDLVFDQDKATMYVVLKEVTLSDMQEKQGPPADIAAHAQSFRETYDNVQEKDGVLYATIPRVYVNAKDLILERIKDDYVTEKVVNITLR